MIKIDLIPPWVKWAVAGAVVAVAFSSGWKVASWKATKNLMEKEKEITLLSLDLRQAQSNTEILRSEIDKTNKSLTKMKKLRDEADRLYQEALAKPPKVVTEYRDRWHEARRVIVSETCEESLGELFEYLGSLEGNGGG